jgi:phosphohistidine phosphatase
VASDISRRLHLLRHAKSSWDEPGLDDHERPLTPRGQRAAARLAVWIGEHGPRPQLVLCSTAVRARQTLDLVADALGEPPVELEEALYHASAGELAARVRRLDDGLLDVLVVGHNPGLHDVALMLAAPSPERDEIVAKLPTGALVAIELDVPWARVAGEGPGRIVSLVVPRRLD